jgi:lipopolysaccharide export system protein LptA
VIVTGPITIKSGIVSIPLRCAAPSANCASATAQLTIVEQLRKGRVTALAAAKKGKTTKRTVVIGSATVTLGAGQAETLKFSLNAAGKKLLAQHRELAAQVQITSESQTIKTQVIHLRMPIDKAGKN